MRFPNLKRSSYPKTVAEAVEILSNAERKAIAVSGGVSFIFAPHPGIEEVVFLRRLPLSYIRSREGGLEIGATTLISELVESKAATNYAGGVLWDAARRIGSTLNRNLITAGGNLVQPFIWSDLPAVALALGAKFRLQGKKARTIPAAEFFAQPPRDILEPGELLVEICFPPFSASARMAQPHRPDTVGAYNRAAYRKFALTENDFAILKIAVVLNRRGRFGREIVIVAGGGTILPQRLSRAEKVILKKNASQSLVNQAADEAAAEIKLVRDIRCSEEYKRDVCRALLRGILEEILLDQESGEAWKLF
jgi:carbon-monoxide dehydrogenase medium subunit